MIEDGLEDWEVDQELAGAKEVQRDTGLFPEEPSEK